MLLKELKEKIWLDFIETFPQYEDMTPDFDSIRFEEEEIQNWKLHHQHDLTSIWDFEQWNTEENAREVLRKAGYFIDNLWHADDVRHNYKKPDNTEIENDEALDILDNALTNDATMSQIWFAISMHAEEHKNLVQKKDE